MLPPNHHLKIWFSIIFTIHFAWATWKSDNDRAEVGPKKMWHWHGTLLPRQLSLGKGVSDWLEKYLRLEYMKLPCSFMHYVLCYLLVRNIEIDLREEIPIAINQWVMQR